MQIITIIYLVLIFNLLNIYNLYPKIIRLYNKIEIQEVGQKDKQLQSKNMMNGQNI